MDAGVCPPFGMVSGHSPSREAQACPINVIDEASICCFVLRRLESFVDQMNLRGFWFDHLFDVERLVRVDEV
jgi:hypothetical protein